MKRYVKLLIGFLALYGLSTRVFAQIAVIIIGVALVGSGVFACS